MLIETNKKKFYIIFAQRCTILTVGDFGGLKLAARYLIRNILITDTMQYVNLEDSVNSKFSEPYSPNPSANLTYRRPELVNCTIEI